MASVKDSCDPWIELAYENWLGWLRASNKKNSSYMRESTRNMVERMWRCSRDLNRQEEAWNLLERLKKLGNNFTQLEDEFGTKSYLYEHAEIYLECALVAYKMGDIQEAISLFKISVAGFPNRSLHKAIGYWLYGCIQWQSQSHREDALISWEKSLQIVNDVKIDNNHDKDYSEKCSEIGKKAEQAIIGASISNYPPPVEPEESKKEDVSGKEKNNSARQTSSKPASARLRIFPILSSIPAGPPSAAKDADWERLELEELEINGKFHTIHSLSLTDEREINIIPGKSYYLLQVDGDSMNAATPVSLFRGDFVLMVEQKTAESGSIVAVEYEDGLYVKTLKKYYKKDKSHIFESQSDRNDISPYFTLNNDFVIRGVAIAVLKPS